MIKAKQSLIGRLNNKVIKEEPNLQNKEVSITENGQTNISADSSYDGLDNVTVNTNITPILQSKSISITENGSQTITPDTGYDGLSQVDVSVNVSSGGDLSEYFTDNISYATSTIGGTYSGVLQMIKKIPDNIIVNGNNLSRGFFGAQQLESVALFDTSNVTDMGACFNSCKKLSEVPAFNTSNVTYMQNIFGGCPLLTNDSLNNILAMCINSNITNTSTKTLMSIGLTQKQATICQSLSNYQAFLDAGWTTGY